MLPLLHLVKWKATSGPRVVSCSMLVDFIQIHIRNVFLFGFGLALAKQVFGENIHCQTDKSTIDQVIVDMKCFINGTWSKYKDESFYHDYYQWIPLILFMLAISFHLPCRIWFKWMGNFIQEVTANLKDRESCEKVLYLVKESRGNGLFWKTWILEFVYAIQFMLQIGLLDLTFHHMWSKSGWSPSIIPQLFPDMARCDHDYFAASFKTTGKFTCLLPLNTAYRKMWWITYVIFIVLFILQMICHAYRIYLVCFYGREQIDMWWCMKIASSRAETWNAKVLLMNMNKTDIMCPDSPCCTKRHCKKENCISLDTIVREADVASAPEKRRAVYATEV